eukprot:GEMP01062005.1.p1 GENE.GEMP01062005.1~~GEMP01062005.1.p1  ORF type:complete len:234 (+),score=38.58 GEMP01062005.1:30-731(+)
MSEWGEFTAVKYYIRRHSESWDGTVGGSDYDATDDDPSSKIRFGETEIFPRLEERFDDDLMDMLDMPVEKFVLRGQNFCTGRIGVSPEFSQYDVDCWKLLAEDDDWPTLRDLELWASSLINWKPIPVRRLVHATETEVEGDTEAAEDPGPTDTYPECVSWICKLCGDANEPGHKHNFCTGCGTHWRDTEVYRCLCGQIRRYKSEFPYCGLPKCPCGDLRPEHAFYVMESEPRE